KQVIGAHQVRFNFGKAAFAVVRVAGDQRFADEKSEHGVSEKLELLVVLEGSMIAGRLFVGVGTVGKRAVQDLPVVKPVAGTGFQRVQLRARHFGQGFFSGVAAGAGAAVLPAAALPWVARTLSACANWRIAGFRSLLAISLSRMASASSYLPAAS